jgi:hypothetical protein
VSDPKDVSLTSEQAYEVAFRFVAQYYGREHESLSLRLLLGNMEMYPEGTSDPASWTDWQNCVRDTLNQRPLPAFGGD